VVLQRQSSVDLWYGHTNTHSLALSHSRAPSMPVPRCIVALLQDVEATVQLMLSYVTA
jgi:hypothetical protein